MEKVIIVSCVVVLIISYFEAVLTSQKIVSSLDARRTDEDENKISPMWFSPRLGRKKRNSKDDLFKSKLDQDLIEILEEFEDSPLTIVAINGNDKLVCKNLKGKRMNYDPNPRLGRSLDEDVAGNEKWLHDADNSVEYMMQRSPPFAPRLGRRFSQFIPRLGREI